MKVYNELKDAFNDVLNKQKKPTAGIDKISADTYADIKKRYIKGNQDIKTADGKTLLNIMEKSILINKYTFSPYTEILVLKGAHQLLRRISKPTIKDKILLKLLNKRIIREGSEYKKLSKKAYTTVHSIKTFLKSNKNVNYLKLDISKYYDSIDPNR